MSIVFFGTPTFALNSLEALLKNAEHIPLVVTQPDRLGGRGHKVFVPPVKEFSVCRGIPVLQPSSIREQGFISELHRIKPEFIVVVAYGRILPKEILDLPSGGCINVHGSLLPRYRGAAPIQRALLAGDKITGVTIMKMDEGLDTGDIILKKELIIEQNDTSQSLFEKLSVTGADAIVEALKGLRDGLMWPYPQSGEPSYAPPLRKDEGKINWNRSAQEIFNFIRGMHPWPSAYTFLGNERIKVLKASCYKGAGEPGVVYEFSGDSLIVGTADGLVKIDEVQPAGKCVMKARAFAAGRRLREKHDKFV
ncbi:MAG: methionyl-tRNA formyltransferase [Nitrospirae bacterium]|nr:methionyl-tRNA formyltransferase [Nitrospirota bacterium]